MDVKEQESGEVGPDSGAAEESGGDEDDERAEDSEGRESDWSFRGPWLEEEEAMSDDKSPRMSSGGVGPTALEGGICDYSIDLGCCVSQT